MDSIMGRPTFLTGLIMCVSIMSTVVLGRVVKQSALMNCLPESKEKANVINKAFQVMKLGSVMVCTPGTRKKVAKQTIFSASCGPAQRAREQAAKAFQRPSEYLGLSFECFLTATVRPGHLMALVNLFKVVTRAPEGLLRPFRRYFKGFLKAFTGAQGRVGSSTDLKRVPNAKGPRAEKANTCVRVERPSNLIAS